MQTGKKVVIGGDLNDKYEGSLKLVFENGVLCKSTEHRHSCGGKVALIYTEGKNSGAILICENCQWRKVLGRREPNENGLIFGHYLLHHLFYDKNMDTANFQFYCTSCMMTVITENKEKCDKCTHKETVSDVNSEIKT